MAAKANAQFCAPCDKMVNECEEVIQSDSKCLRWYHKKCAKLSNIHFQECVADKKKTWACGSDECALLAIKELLRKDLEDIKQSMSFINKSFEDLKTIRSQMQNSIDNVTKLAATLTEVVNITNKEQAQIKEELSDMRQYTRSNNIEIHGIQEEKSGNIYDIVCKIANTLKVGLTLDSIHDQSLYKRATDLRQISYKFVWTHYCKVFVKKDKSSCVIYIKNEDVLSKKPASCPTRTVKFCFHINIQVRYRENLQYPRWLVS
ncbi:hypothetical protein PR048_031940 [Dryococelus australis]|uniref:FP protein C-terminal domain-containing protein n=1 Tax=Dryococelus australis TaxID=614101 RepID=A0ABQ9G6Q0_9NEOP|nr:hypothetical protein PR048_031940 [Dryococelus australis]